MPTSTSCKLQLIDTIESVMKYIHLKAHLFLNYNEKNKEHAKYEMIGFQLKHQVKQLKEFYPFEKDFFNEVTSLKFRKLNCSFQEMN